MKNYLLLLTFLFIAFDAFAQETVVHLTDKDELLLIGKSTYFLEDSEGKMTIQDILKPENQVRFALYHKDAFAQLATTSAFWFKIIVQNQSQEDAWIEIATNYASYIDYYAPDSLGNYSKAHQTGTLRPQSNKFYAIPNAFWLPLSKAKDTHVHTYYLRITEEYPFEAPLQVGTIRSLSQNNKINDYLTAGFVGVLIIMLLYNTFLYVSTKEHIYALYLAYLFTILFVLPNLNNYTLLLDPAWSHLYFLIWQPIVYFFIGLFCIYYLKLAKHLPFVRKLILFDLLILCGVFPLLTLFGIRLIYLITLFQLFVIILYLICIISAYYLAFKGHKNARFYALGWTFFIAGVFTFLAVVNGFLPYSPFTRNAMYFGGVLEIWMFSLALGNRMNLVQKENEKLIKEQNQVLAQKVEEKTKDIQLKNEALQTTEEELRQNMEELEANQELLQQQKETIEFAFKQLSVQNTKVNDSIRYAQRIQNAILPHADTLMYAFTEHFIIFKPKDVVSGDFYWYLEIENKKFIAVVDCTGHGVPGAFMSMIGNTLLYEIINAKRIFEPHYILEHLHLGILNALNRKDAEIQDGMDIALCCIEEGENQQVKVKFSGAKRPLYYFSHQGLREVQANKKSIGQSQSAEKNYDLHELFLNKGDTLYMTTDGWIDAINPERKRFGSKQLKEMLLKGANLPLKAQEEVFRYILEDYEQGTEQRDDVLVVGIKI